VYFGQHPQLADELIDALLDKGVSVIAVDCADRGCFIIENLCNLNALIECGGLLTVHTYPMNFADVNGLPCRMIAEVE